MPRGEGIIASGVPSYWGIRGKTMETVSIVVLALLVAVVGQEILDPPRVR
jgi:hypothetical protein